ncbi:HNH endonuclease signature motif containing protein [Paraburkholderia graminis]|uniref:HNH endonuclease signature motif containing protein n=1 Tax=Paraburkholderia graminis TaxID=60548 RepID=UPI000DEF53C8|nr:HNH endonuclease signature motif containing protein [Paraburkholderia graminis]
MSGSPKGASLAARRSVSEGVKDSWKDPKVARARGEHHAAEVTVDGITNQYKSVADAARSLGLDGPGETRHIRFRGELKERHAASPGATHVWTGDDGKQYFFRLVDIKATSRGQRSTNAHPVETVWDVCGRHIDFSLPELPPSVKEQIYSECAALGVVRGTAVTQTSSFIKFKGDREAAQAYARKWPSNQAKTNKTEPDDDDVDDTTFDDLHDNGDIGSDIAEQHIRTVKQYKRRMDTRKAVLARTDHCERNGCGEKQRFPGFLEVHHILGVMNGDRPWNCVAICPNCHSEAHYSPQKDQLNNDLLEYASRFRR